MADQTLPLRERHFDEIPGLLPRPQNSSQPLAFSAEIKARPRVCAVTAPSPPRLMSSFLGEISALLMCMPAYSIEPINGQENPLLNIYKSLFLEYPRNAKLIVLTHAKYAATVLEFVDRCGLGRRANVIPAPDVVNFSVWAEDPYLVVTDKNNGLWFVEPTDFLRFGDSRIADEVAEQFPIGLRESLLRFRGGNILVGDTFVFVGADTYFACINSARPDNPNRVFNIPSGDVPETIIPKIFQEELDKAKQLMPVGSAGHVIPNEQISEFQLEGDTWREIKYFGNDADTQQPIFHIDMFVTLAGRRNPDGPFRVLVGDPGMAANILQVPCPDHAMAFIFDDIAARLAYRGFEVVRNPLPLVYLDDRKNKFRTWYFATSNNALVQKSADENIVWLPTYGYGPWSMLKATDQKNKEIWQTLGYQVKQLTDFHPLAQHLGALHCIKKYVERN